MRLLPASAEEGWPDGRGTAKPGEAIRRNEPLSRSAVLGLKERREVRSASRSASLSVVTPSDFPPNALSFVFT